MQKSLTILIPEIPISKEPFIYLLVHIAQLCTLLSPLFLKLLFVFHAEQFFFLSFSLPSFCLSQQASPDYLPGYRYKRKWSISMKTLYIYIYLYIYLFLALAFHKTLNLLTLYSVL